MSKPTKDQLKEAKTKYNKYNLKVKDIQKAIILDYDKLHKSPFWRNDIIKAWCLSGGVGKGFWGDYQSEYWIGFYDNDADSYAGKIRISCTCMEEMCSYNFNTFFSQKSIDNHIDFEFQIELLKTLNWLIDEKIIEIS